MIKDNIVYAATVGGVVLFRLILGAGFMSAGMTQRPARMVKNLAGIEIQPSPVKWP